MNKKIALSIICITFLAGCGQYKEIKNLTKCEFKIKSMEDFELAGVDVQNIKSLSDLNLLKAGKITNSLLQGKLPLSFTINIEARNPNNKIAAINELEWIAFIDDTEIVKGITKERIEIEPNGGTKIIPLYVKVDLKEIFSEETGQKLIPLALSVVNSNRDDSRIGIKVKPTIKVGKKFIQYPGYIKIKRMFSSD